MRQRQLANARVLVLILRELVPLHVTDSDCTSGVFSLEGSSDGHFLGKQFGNQIEIVRKRYFRCEVSLVHHINVYAYPNKPNQVSLQSAPWLEIAP